MPNEIREYRNISTLRSWEKNPRSITEKDFNRLKNQIKKLGQYKPLIITADGEVIGGNMRLKAYQALGIQNVWVSTVTPKNEAEKLEYALSDNDRAGQYEEELLAQLILETPDFSADDYRLDLGKLSTIKELLSKFSPDPDEDDVPEIDQTVSYSKQGEVYQLGEHRLMCGDSTNLSDYQKLMNGALADLIFTDPPYNVDYKGGGGQKRSGIKNDKMSAEAFEQFLSNALSAMMKVSADHAPFYICMSPKELGTLKQAFEKNGGHWQGTIIWVKNKFTLGGSDYQHQYEPILYGWKDGCSHFWAGDRNKGDVWESLEEIKPHFDGIHTILRLPGYEIKLEGKVDGQIIRKKEQSNIWRFDKPLKSDEHPTMKPVKLVTHALRNSSQIGNIVLDPFGGSGSTLIASHKTDRICYTMELDPKYCDVIRKRYVRELGEQESDWQELTPAIKE